MGDEMGGGAEDMRGRAVVALQPDDGGARKILLEAQDVVDLGAAPAIDRLVVVADAADVDFCCRSRPHASLASLASGGGGLAGPTPGRACGLRPCRRSVDVEARAGIGALRQQPQPHVLGGVGVLVLVDEDVAEAPVIFLQHIRIGAEDADRMQQEVAEVAGVQRLQPFLIGLVELAALAVGEARGRRPRGCRPGLGPCSSSRRSSGRTAWPASACRRGPRPGSAA